MRATAFRAEQLLRHADRHPERAAPRPLGISHRHASPKRWRRGTGSPASSRLLLFAPANRWPSRCPRPAFRQPDHLHVAQSSSGGGKSPRSAGPNRREASHSRIEPPDAEALLRRATPWRARFAVCSSVGCALIRFETPARPHRPALEATVSRHSGRRRFRLPQPFWNAGSPRVWMLSLAAKP